ncbi:MAG: hypothetical protein ACKVIU_06075 [Rhodobacterales bacterium]|jgi:hypothetical protein
MSDSVITQLKASPVRRGFALLVMMLLGFLLLYLTMTTDASFFHKVFLVAVAAAVLWMARAMQRGTTGYIELRNTGLFFEDGRTLALIDDITRVERGVFAFKPSNGFVVSLKQKTDRAWIPGMYWKFGARIGIGGVTAPSDAKFMSDTLAVLIAEREGSSLMGMKL